MMCLPIWQIVVVIVGLTIGLSLSLAIIILAMGWLEDRVDAWQDRRMIARQKKGGRR